MIQDKAAKGVLIAFRLQSEFGLICVLDLKKRGNDRLNRLSASVRIWTPEEPLNSAELTRES